MDDKDVEDGGGSLALLYDHLSTSKWEAKWTFDLKMINLNDDRGSSVPWCLSFSIAY